MPKTAALNPSLTTPDWPAPRGIRACATTRAGGLSLAPYDSFNLAEHTGDDPDAVCANRNALYAALRIGAPPRWLEQQHGGHVIDPADPDVGPQADGSCTSAQGVVCAVLTADCLPVLLCDRDGTRVAALHCGWRGIARGILSAGIAAMQRPPSRLLAWLGPAIGPTVYEVGEDVRQALTTMSGALAAAFQPTRAGHWHPYVRRLVFVPVDMIMSCFNKPIGNPRLFGSSFGGTKMYIGDMQDGYDAHSMALRL